MEKDVIIQDGRVVARGCTAVLGGCGFVGGNLFVNGGTVLFQDCRAEWEGGGIYLKHGTYQQRGTSKIAFQNCSASSGGGGLFMQVGPFYQHAGDLSFQRCFATSSGGGLSMNNSFHQSGIVEGKECTSEFGGLIFATEVFIRGAVDADDCRAAVGGCIDGHEAVTITGNLTARNCHADHSGGVISTQAMKVSGHLEIQNCHAKWSGGAVNASNLLLENATAHFQNTSAFRGGAITAIVVVQEGGEFWIKKSRSKREGGAIASEIFSQSSGNASFTSCIAGSGGALELYSMESWGTMIFEKCRATKSGGAILADFVVTMGRTSFNRCHSKNAGGAIYARNMMQGGHLHAANCRAGVGGAVSLDTNIKSHKTRRMALPITNYWHVRVNLLWRGKLQTSIRLFLKGRKAAALLYGDCSFQHCTAAVGCAMSVRGTILLNQSGKAMVEDCHGEGPALEGNDMFLFGQAYFRKVLMGVIQSFGTVKLVSPVIQETSAMYLPQISATKGIDISNASFQNSSLVVLLAPQIQVKNVSCENGLQSFKDAHKVGCKACDENRVQFSGGPILDENISAKGCVLTPRGTAKVGPRFLKLKMGYMTEKENITKSFRCPNHMACIGGTVSTDGWGEMCAAGYQGRGCLDCAKSYAVSDLNSFICLKCSSSLWQQVFQMARFVLQDLLLFVLSTMGVSSGTSKDSKILTNQFMSFVAAATPVLEVVRDTPTFKRLVAGNTVDEYIKGLSSTMEVGESSSSGVSAMCILSYLNLPQEYWCRTLLILFTPFCSIATLALARGWRLAAVVGVNCFLPKVCICFAGYLACFRMEPESEGGEQFCLFSMYTGFPFVPLVAIVSSIALAGPAIWWWLLKDEANKDTAFYIYLTGSYKEELKSWEVTRLVRKVALAIVSAALPISLHPATQIFCISFILLTALALEAQMHPYKDHHWNLEEKTLLNLSLALAIFTSCYMAHENHWSSGYHTQCFLLSVIFMLCIVPSNILIYLILRQLLRERGIGGQS